MSSTFTNSFGFSPLDKLMEQDPVVYADVLARLAAADFHGAVRMVATAAGMPPWVFSGLESLLTGDVHGARAAVESALGSKKVRAYIGLVLNYAINASGVPPTVLSAAPGIITAASAGNASAVLRALGGAYGLEPWATEAVVVLVDAARSGSTSGLASLLSSDTTSSALAEVLEAYNVSVKMETIGLASEFASAVAAGDVQRIASMLALTVAANPPRCVPHGSAKLISCSCDRVDASTAVKLTSLL